MPLRACEVALAPRLKRIDVESMATETLPLATLPAELVVGSARFTVRSGKARAASASRAAPTLNGVALSQSKVLVHGDVVDTGAALVVYLDATEAREPRLEALLHSTPGARTVYADWLSERGDPLGAHLQQNARLAPTRGSGLYEGLWPDLTRGTVHLEWREGLVHAASLRAGPSPHDWTRLLAQLLNLRVAFSLRELVLDVPELLRGRGDALTSAQLRDGLEHALRLVRASPVAPHLERLVLGYAVAPDAASDAVLADFTSTELGPLFLRRPSATLLVEAAPPELAGRIGTRLELRTGLTIDPPTRPAVWPFRLEHPARLRDLTFFRVFRGRWVLSAASGEVPARLNGVAQDFAPLLPGDRLQLPSGLVLRFELGPPNTDEDSTGLPAGAALRFRPSGPF